MPADCAFALPRVRAASPAATPCAPSSDSLAELGRLACGGDGPALDRLLRAVQTPVHRFLLARLAPRADANDVAGDLLQEVLIRAAAALPRCRFMSGERLVAWVLTIARHVLVDHHRVERARREVVAHEALDRAVEGASLARWRSDAGDHGRSELLEELAAAAMGGLPERTRELLRLRVQLGCTWKEVGAVLGTTEAGAKRRFQRAQVALRTRFRALLDAVPPARRERLLHGLRLPPA